MGNHLPSQGYGGTSGRDREHSSWHAVIVRFMIVSSCLPSTRTSSSRVCARPVLTGLCLLAKTPPPPCSGTFLHKPLTSRDFSALLPFNHSLQPRRSTVPHAPASLSCKQPDMGPTTETVRRAAPGGGRLPAFVSLGRVASRRRGQLARLNLDSHPCGLTCPRLQGA